MRDQADAAAIVAGKLSAYGGGASAIFFGLTASEFAAVVGAVVAVCGLVVQWYFNRRRDKREHDEFIASERREQAEFEAKMRSYDR